MTEDLPLQFEEDLLLVLEQEASVVTVPKGSVLLCKGGSVAAVPIVLKGLIKVDRVEEDRELLLYYIRPGQSCIMSFTAILHQTNSSVLAIAEEECEVLLIPAEKLEYWHRKFPSLQRYYLELYQQYYEGLLTTIDELAFHKMDSRILNYLHKKVEARGTALLKMTHQQIAHEVGSTREVVSRVLKKLETEGEVNLGRNEIEVLN